MHYRTPDNQAIPQDRLCNRSRLALLLGVSLTTIDRWVKDGMPYLQRPAPKSDREAPAAKREWVFDIAEIFAWWRDPRLASPDDLPMLSDADREAIEAWSRSGGPIVELPDIDMADSDMDALLICLAEAEAQMRAKK
jgi:phage terminase Nu1 subunit (DNA packaging protein)